MKKPVNPNHHTIHQASVRLMQQNVVSSFSSLHFASMGKFETIIVVRCACLHVGGMAFTICPNNVLDSNTHTLQEYAMLIVVSHTFTALHSFSANQ